MNSLISESGIQLCGRNDKNRFEDEYKSNLNEVPSNNESVNNARQNLKTLKITISVPEPEENEVVSKPIHLNSHDIEVHIPVANIVFNGQVNNNDLTPYGSLASPYFGDLNQSMHSSPRCSVSLSEYLVEDSPISVGRIPHNIDKLVEFPLSKVEKKTKKKNNDELITCEVCQREIRKKSYKAHLLTKIHKTNLKENS